jgi:hypothetical protein
VYEPGRRETGGGGATLPPAQRPTPNAQAPNTQAPNAQHPTPNTQHPTPNTQHPTPNTQAPNAQRPAAASPTLHLAQRRAYHRSAHEQGFRTLYRSRSKVASSPVNAPGVALPRVQRPTPNARETQRPRDPTPNVEVINPSGWSTAQLCWCYGAPQTPFVDPQDARPRRRHP